MLLPPTRDNLPILLERRAEYAKIADTRPINFSSFFHDEIDTEATLTTIDVGTYTAHDDTWFVADPFYLSKDFSCPLRQPGARKAVHARLVLAKMGDWGQRVAMAQLDFGDPTQTVDTWQLALTTEEGAIAEFFKVDHGLACIADTRAAKAFIAQERTFFEQTPTGDFYHDVMAQQLPEDADWCLYTVDDSTLFITSTGLGDGLYSCYWGLTAAGQRIQLTIDFQLFDHDGCIARQP